MKKLFLTTILIILCPKFSYAHDTRSDFNLPSKVQVTIIEANFYRKKFKIEGYGINENLCRINGQIPFGTTFYLPKIYIKSITILFQGKSYALDASNMYDAWKNSPLNYSKGIRNFGGKCIDTQNCKFRGIFSDTVGIFVAEWIIINGRSLRTVMSSNDDVIDLFFKKIDPPGYD